ncbi:hypothetical protein BDN70DRAFT_997819 [Pholiota conissans]|uniref:Uncharacterized protein n=1 Tax=Pholiota conissans TaxID=109636 RepID=A0A9P5YR17_9AGAR|nr:hypothetical protein BDN70DRAFT_997819 [Pholiota conissans]
MCPNLCALGLDIGDHPEATFRNIESISLVPPPLEHLYLSSGKLFGFTKTMSRFPWCSLTYITIRHIAISLRFWFSLLHSTPSMQSIYVDVHQGSLDLDSENLTERIVLQHLTSLFITITSENRIDVNIMFTNIFLPSLHTLSVLSSWLEHQSIANVHNILETAPNLKTLAIGEYFLSPRSLWDFVPTIINGLIGEKVPIWTHNPHLTHLQFVSIFLNGESIKFVEEAIPMFVRHIFSPDSEWLGLERSDCPIRTISIVNNALEKISDATLSKLCKHISDSAGNVQVELTQTSLACQEWEARRIWG